MTWQLAILTHQLLETIFALVYRKYAKKHSHRHDHYVTNAIMYLATIVPFGIVWSITQGGPSLDFSGELWWFFVLAGLLFALGNMMVFRANTKVEASQFAIIYSFRTVVIVAASWLLLQEGLEPLQLAGAALVLGAGLFVIRLRKPPVAQKRHGLYSVFAVAAAVLMGLAITNEKYILDGVTLATYVVIGWGLQAFFMALLAHRQFGRVKVLIKDGSIKIILLLGVLRAVAGFAFINALQLSDNAALIGSIAALHIILVTIGGYIFLRERKYGGYKFAAASAAFVGVVLLVS